MHDASMLKKYLYLSIVTVMVLFLMSAQARCAENIRVAIADNKRSIVLASASGLVVEGRAALPRERTMTVENGSVGSRPLRVRSAGDFIRVNGKNFRGLVELRKKKNGLLLVVNELDVELYLLGVVASEIPHEWHRETLKAQAVASRTYALYQKRMAEGRPYHVLATEDSQMYNGRSGERSTTSQAVRDTAGTGPDLRWGADPCVLSFELRRAYRGRFKVVGHSRNPTSGESTATARTSQNTDNGNGGSVLTRSPMRCANAATASFRSPLRRWARSRLPEG